MPGNPWDNDPIVGTVGPAQIPQGIGRPVIRKGAPEQSKVVKDNYVIDPNTATAQPITGLPVDAGDDEPGLDPTAAGFYAQQILAGGAMPALGMGKAAAKARQQIMNQVAVIAGGKGLTGTDLAKQVAHYKAGQKQVGVLETQLGTTQQNEQTAVLNGQQFMDRSAELPGQTQLPIINSIVQAAQRHLPVPGHDTIAAMDVAWNTFANEYAKVVSGTPSGGGVLSDSARHEAMKVMQGNYSLSQKEAAFSQMKVDMANRLAAMNGTIDQAYQHITEQPGQHQDATVPGVARSASAPDVNPIANGGDGDQGPTLGPSGGNTRSVIDPKKQALAEKIAGLVQRGADRNTIMGFAVGADPTLRSDQVFRGWVDDALKYRQQHPNAKYPIDPGFYTTEVPLSSAEQFGNDVAQSAPVAAGTNFVNGATAGNYANLAGAVGGDKSKVEDALAVAAQQHPNASLAGTVAGGATAALGLEGLLARLGLGPGLARAAIADTGYGATAGATNAPEGQGAEGAVKGGIAALLGSAGGNLLARGAGSVARGGTNPAVGYVAKDIPLTIGQAVGQSGIVGRAVKGLEDRAAGLPVIGDTINARRLEGLQKMNSKAFDRALEPIREKAGGKFGEEAVAAAQDKVSGAFTKALAGKSASLDHGFIVEAEKGKMAIDGLPDRVRGEVNDSVDEVVNNYFDDNGQISGENMQALLRDLGGIKRAYRADPLGNRVGKAVDQISDSVENLFRRQAPDVMPQYDAAKKAFKRVSTLEDAVLRAKNTNGVFTPGQLGMADRANTIKYGGKHTAAAGGGEFHDFQRNMQEVLPNKVPDSGTVGRLLIPAAVVGTGTGAGYASGDTGTGLTLGALLSLAYSRAGQRVLTGAALKGGSARRAVGSAVKKAAPLIGHGAAAQTALGAVRD